ncbi:MAG: hypothetical protein KDK91_25655, partial [Gammaproteobacteria bacterium]|nr:hypothetical protein [Gammaproteobacteria bacterium]
HALAVAGERRFEMVYAALQRAPDEPALPRELNGLPIDIWALDAGLLETAVLRERVEAFVRHGGGVLLTLDPRLASDAASNVTSSRELALPGGLRAVDAITYPGSGAALASTLTTGRARKDNDTSGWPDRLDAALGAPALLGALAQVRVYSARTLRGLDRSDVTILLSLEDGHPWLVEQTLGSGRLVLSTSGLMPPSTNLALEPGFVPLAQRLVEHLAGRTPVPAWLQRGEVVDLRQVAALTPNGAAWRDFLANRGSVVLEHADGTRQRSTPGQPFVTLGTPGLTRVHASDGSQPALLLAANENRRESLLDRATPEQLLARMEHLPALPASARASRASATAGDGPRPADGRPLGWYLLWIALLLLLGEGLLAALSRRSPAATR